jgi:predicted esterase
MSTSRLPRPWAALLLASSLGCVSILGMRTVRADDVKLKNGMTLHGMATEIETLALTPKKVPSGPTNLTPVLLVATPLSRYFIPRLQKDSIAEGADLGRHEGFKLPQIKQRGGTRILGAMQGYLEKPEWFDDFGHRKVLINVAGGDEWIYQGVKEITPRYLKVIGLNIGWETAIAASSVPVEVLDAMIRRACNPKNPQDLKPEDRIRIARFYIDAAMYEPANRELLAIRSNYPEMSDTVALVQAHLMEAQANDLLSELRMRRAAGQHRFVIDAAKQFPAENVSAGVLREVREIGGDYAKAHERAEQIVAQLGELQGQIKDKNRVAEIAPLRAEIIEKLNYSNLERLDAFFNLAGDAQLKPEEKLALAFSGWISGSAGAVTELDAALRFWQARYLLLEYLRTAPDDETARKTILTKLEALEGIGPERIAQLIPFLPPVLEPAGAEPGNAVKIDLGSTEQEQKRAYWVSLPLEYDPSRSYPMIVALHDGARPYESGTLQQELGFWGGSEDKPGQSQRHGFIVIAPEYVTKEDTKGYDYAAKSHQVVIDAIRDARRRFSVDSERVFLAGHGMGADATWDIGLSHPDLFAGIIPISGAIDRYAKYYIENGRMLGIYSISGELDHDLLNRNANSYMRMITPLNLDLIYCEYVGAGPESFYSEIHLLFDWMSKQRRQEIPKKIDIKTLRETDNQFYWLEFSKLLSSQTGINWSAKKPQVVHPLNVVARITPGNIIQISPAPAENYRIWLPKGEGLIDFNKRLRVQIKGKDRFPPDFVKPDIAAMLEHVRIHGDRQQLYWAVLEF